MKTKNKKRAIVALSGGIDSAVAATLLKQKGMEVIGVFFDLGNFSSAQKKKAKRITQILSIDFLNLNLKKEFKIKVIDYFLKELKTGVTPNPCIVCNPQIKFRNLIKLSKRFKADYIATGHYAKVQKRKDGMHLYKGRDREKEQSYFLWQLNQNQLKHLIFPLADLTKTEVKKIAKGFGLPVLDTPESQEICFIRNGLSQFLKKHLKLKPGDIVDRKGQILGKHEGLPLYTIGQRKGIRLAQGPYFVLGKNIKKNLLIVIKDEKDLYKKDLTVKDINWILGEEPKLPIRVKAKIRYRHQATSAVIKKQKKYKVILDKAQRAITPGQSVVFYKRNELIGGGIII